MNDLAKGTEYSCHCSSACVTIVTVSSNNMSRLNHHNGLWTFGGLNVLRDYKKNRVTPVAS